MNSLQIAEWQRFGENEISGVIGSEKAKKAFAELVDFAHGYGNDKFIGFVNSHTLKAKNFVGLIQTKSGFVLEILPKIFEKDDEFDSKKSRDLLFKMLKTLKNSPFKRTQMANLKAKNFPLLEIFAIMFLDELDIIIKSGIKNNYVEISQNRHFLKGKLLFNEHLKANLIHKERFYTNADEFIANIPENRIIVSALNLLFKFGFSAKTTARLANAKFVFSDILESKNLSADFSKCQSSRHFSRYEIALAWCKIFLKNESFTQYSGSDKAFALLFDMNLLFESFVADYFKKHSEFEIKTQNSSKYLLADNGGENLFKMRPDILAIKGENTIILDTKWKIIKSIKDDISQSDLYQIFAYAEKYKSQKNVLIYPKIGKKDDLKYFYKANKKELQILFFEIFDENAINSQIQKILNTEKM
ncbi:MULTISPECIES: McrC family protein [unclassified Campylobacter]|uniref:McrC family protein n=1 Tax=unclassified Campylobacter TaxID=2593542 RepID=UPI0022E9CF4D|nr:MULTISPECIES: McrC family protein [unclassified Campylobacter]MDA3055805.1 McrC family protein [Campylobacter sp. CN_NA1]MDA3065909.1 McrC family protein [Campylobacter sp. CN_NE4]MDA3068661.1 McrC family protein [Campylobacter sp. CN_NE3]MDA3080331.1 McrC family protein [Campylobacter sp. CS_NA2]MDA3081804.1 McrC family protein [Campylobacter sp. CS_NA1]